MYMYMYNVYTVLHVHVHVHACTMYVQCHVHVYMLLKGLYYNICFIIVTCPNSELLGKNHNLFTAKHPSDVAC